MPTLPEEICIGYAGLDEIFPFHLLIEIKDSLLITHCGPALQNQADAAIVGSSLTDTFEFERPPLENPDVQQMQSLIGKLVCLRLLHSNIVLRGQMVPVSGDQYLYISTLHITSSNTFADMEISLAEFPAHDLTPDLLIMRRVKERQLEDLTAQNSELSQVIEERNKFDEYANTDSTTELLNRRGFHQKVESHLLSVTENEEFALLLIDVDNFKSINDMYGHFAGDAVLQEIARRLKQQLGDDSVIGRWGGDEFVALVRFNTIPSTDNDIERLRGSFEYNDETIDVSLSCGVVNTSVAHDLEKLIHYADVTMYEGRRRTPGKTFFFQDELESVIRQREKISSLIKPAIDERQFQPYFQPIIDIETSKLVGFEALARWPSPDLGMVFPLDFIAVAESKNLQKEFDYMMLGLVVEQLSAWHADYPELKVHINLSAPTFTNDLPDYLSAKMLQAQVPFDRLVVEITETSLFVSVDDIGTVIRNLVAEGFSVELDDFGTGYSSLIHLKDFPVTGLKIDMSFVREADSNTQARKLLAAILDMAKNLQLHSVAEGVETDKQLEMLTSLECDSAQGYLFSKPVSADDCAAFLVKNSQNLIFRKAA